MIGHNCYAYCLGNPVRYKDSLGNVPEEAPETTPAPSSTPYPQPNPTPPAREVAIPNPITYYSSANEAALAWAKEWRNTDPQYEYGAIIFKSSFKGEERYRIGVTRKGSKGGYLGIRANVIKPLYHGVLFDIKSRESAFALLHTHPLTQSGKPSEAMSEEDWNCTKGIYPFVNLDRIYMIPYGGDKVYIYNKGDDETSILK